jgi:hypothetical protein
LQRAWTSSQRESRSAQRASRSSHRGEHIPDFVQLPPAEVRALTRSSGVDPRLINTTISAALESDTLRGNLSQSPEEMRQEADLTNRVDAIAEELAFMYKGTRAAALVRRHRLGLVALQVYSIAKQLVRRKEHAALLPYVASIKQRNKFGRKRAKPADPAQPKPEPKPEAPLTQSKPQ